MQRNSSKNKIKWVKSAPLRRQILLLKCAIHLLLSGMLILSSLTLNAQEATLEETACRAACADILQSALPDSAKIQKIFTLKTSSNPAMPMM